MILIIKFWGAAAPAGYPTSSPDKKEKKSDYEVFLLMENYGV